MGEGSGYAARLDGNGERAAPPPCPADYHPPPGFRETGGVR
jgi:hypothetical protein